jgi:NADH:ubiquinone reductase (H+-translocating)
MNKETIVVAGGGYAGIHIAEALNKQAEASQEGLRIILLDRNGSHFRKVRLVQAPEGASGLNVPLSEFGWKHVELLQADLAGIDPGSRRLRCNLPDGSSTEIAYDRLVLSLGSVPRQEDTGLGGLFLRDAESAASIRLELERLVRQAETEASSEERRGLLRAVIVGGGISGIETAAGLAARLRRERDRLGASGGDAAVCLVHAGSRLLPEAPAQISRRLERKLRRLGVETVLGVRAEQFDGCSLYLGDGRMIPASLCIRTSGVQPNPIVKSLGLPVHADGRLLTDSWYRVQGCDTIYAIGDCARSVAPATGTPDGMTCKEAIPQAQRLAEILKSEHTGGSIAPHTPVNPMFCISLGTGEGFIWMRKWGLDLVLTGKLGWRVREWTWTMASLGK